MYISVFIRICTFTSLVFHNVFLEQTINYGATNKTFTLTERRYRNEHGNTTEDISTYSIDILFMDIIPKRKIIKNVNISISTVNLKASDFNGSSTKYIAKDTNKIMTQFRKHLDIYLEGNGQHVLLNDRCDIDGYITDNKFRLNISFNKRHYPETDNMDISTQDVTVTSKYTYIGKIFFYILFWTNIAEILLI